MKARSSRQLRRAARRWIAAAVAALLFGLLDSWFVMRAWRLPVVAAAAAAFWVGAAFIFMLTALELRRSARVLKAKERWRARRAR